MQEQTGCVYSYRHYCYFFLYERTIVYHISQLLADLLSGRLQ